MAALSNTSFLPAQARMVAITVYPPVENGLTPAFNWPNKNTSDTLDYWLDLTQIMMDSDTTIIQASADVVSGDTYMSVANTQWSDVYVAVSLSGGTVAQSYVVAVQITRMDGYQETFEIGIYVESLSTLGNPNVGNVLILNGSVITIGSYSLPDGNV